MYIEVVTEKPRRKGDDTMHRRGEQRVRSNTDNRQGQGNGDVAEDGYRPQKIDDVRATVMWQMTDIILQRKNKRSSLRC